MSAANPAEPEMPAEPVTPAEPASPPRAAGRRSMGLALLLAGAGAGALLLASGRQWGAAQVLGVLGRGPAVQVSGQDVNALPTAVGWVGLASVVAVLATRRIGRTVIGALLVLGGAGAAFAAATGAADTSALRSAAVAAGNLDSVRLSHVTHTAWPWLSLAGGVLLASAGLLVLLRGRSWPGMSRKYEAPSGEAAPRPESASAGPADLWKAMDRGEDLTDEPADDSADDPPDRQPPPNAPRLRE